MKFKQLKKNPANLVKLDRTAHEKPCIQFSSLNAQKKMLLNIMKKNLKTLKNVECLQIASEMS